MATINMQKTSIREGVEKGNSYTLLVGKEISAVIMYCGSSSKKLKKEPPRDP
jgi:hypothetical protein